MAFRKKPTLKINTFLRNGHVRGYGHGHGLGHGNRHGHDIFVTVRTETNQNSIYLGSFSVFSRNKKNFSVCFGVSEPFETNRNKKSAFRIIPKLKLIHFYVMDMGVDSDMDMDMVVFFCFGLFRIFLGVSVISKHRNTLVSY
jgi:hypothetical protein